MGDNKVTIISTICMATILLTFLTVQFAYADVISHFPGHLGDPTFSTELTSLGMTDVVSSETTQTTFFVPGAGTTTLTFTFQANGGGFVGSFGFYDVSTVTADPIAQKALYTTQALGGATLVFDDAVVDPGVTAMFNVAGGTELGFFLIPDASLATYLATPGIFLVHGGIIEDSPLFSVSNANDGQFDQLQSFADNGNTLFGWEDITRTGNGKLGASDNDFEDLVFSVDAILPEIIKTRLVGPDPIGIYSPVPITYIYKIAITSAEEVLVIDTVPAEFEVLSLTPSAGTAIDINSGKGPKSQGSTKIEWLVPAGSNMLTVEIQTVKSPGHGKKTPDVFKPTSCGPLPINDGATAFKTDQSGNLVLDPPVTGVPIPIIGPSNSLQVDAIAGAKPCCESAAECNDGVACTADSCEPTRIGCINTPNDAFCDDAQFCNGSETCDSVNDCQPGTPPNQDDGVGCTDDSCDEVNDVIVNTPNDANCDDAQFCNGSETCDAKLDCQPGTPPVLSDGVACTDDRCDEVNDVIVNTANNANCGDSGNVCTDNICDSKLGCVPENNSASCSDFNACTNPDVCSSGTCVGGSTPICVDDGNKCTIEICNPRSGVCESDQLPSCCDLTFCQGQLASCLSKCDITDFDCQGRCEVQSFDCLKFCV